jgi:hypothetical protein
VALISSKGGETGASFIYVYHLLELSSIAKEYKVNLQNPITELHPFTQPFQGSTHYFFLLASNFAVET